MKKIFRILSNDMAGWCDDAVYAVLLLLLRKKPPPGLIDAICEFHRTEPIPLLISYLGNSICCTFAGVNPCFVSWPNSGCRRQTGRLLSPLQDHLDFEIVVRVDRIALALPQENENIRAASRLVGMLSHAPWFLRIEMERWLVDRFDLTLKVIAHEITARSSATNPADPMDEPLRWLHTLQERLTRGHDH